MNDALFERILLPLADADDADRTARAIRPHIESETTLIVSHVTQGDAAETAVKTGQDQFAQTTYETFVSLFDRSDVQLEWVTLEGREIAEALTDAIGIVNDQLTLAPPVSDGDDMASQSIQWESFAPVLTIITGQLVDPTRFLHDDEYSPESRAPN